MSEGKGAWRGVGAVVVGVVVSVSLSLITDMIMTKLGFFPQHGHPPASGPLVAATIYRTVYGVLGAYVCARLAPVRPMFHAMLLGFLGFAVSILGALVSWNQTETFGPRWYPVALVILALPTAWFGGKLRENQLHG